MKNKLQAFWEKIDKKQLLFIALLFILAFATRAHLTKYELLFGFDSYWHARMVSYVIEDGVLPDTDPLAYYHKPVELANRAPVFWYLSAALYWLFSWPFTLSLFAYNKDVWIMFLKILPALYGALICVGMYFLGKEMYNKKAGYAMGVISAVVPSFVYRTMSGFFEEDSLGFLWMVLGLLFLVKAVKEEKINKQSVKNALISGFLFGLMAWTWDMFLLVPLVLIGYFAVTLFNMWVRKAKTKEMKQFTALFAISLVLFAGLASSLHGTKWMKQTYGYVGTALDKMPLIGEETSAVEQRASEGKTTMSDVLSATVGEESVGKRFFGEKYNALILLPLLAIPLLLIKFILIPGLSLFFPTLEKFIDRKDNVSLIVFFWTAICWYMAWSKLKFTYTFGLPIAACAGYLTYESFKAMENKSNKAKATAVGIMLFVSLIGVGAGSFFVVEKTPSIEEGSGWKESLNWMRENTPEDAKFFNWWDDGHWITFIGERAVIVDNANADLKADSDAARFLIDQNTEEADALLKSYGSNYLIMDADTFSKLPSLGLYAYSTLNFNDPRLAKFRCGTTPCNYSVRCAKKTITSGLTGETEISYVCGGQQIARETIESLNTAWTNIPSDVVQGKIPVYYYTDELRNHLYVLNSSGNNTMAAKIWFNSPDTNNYVKAYEYRDVRIYKVN